VEIWMEQLMAFLQKHWQFTIIGCGLLISIGALLNWRWVCEFDHRRVRPFAFDTLVHDFFGDQGYRFLMGISGLVIILCGLVFLFLS
jgi:hypothetical protein